MLLIQLTGLSGSGKSTIAYGVKDLLVKKNVEVEVIDGDVYRKSICADLGYSREDRHENIRRLGSIANSFAKQGKVSIIAAINPYEKIRKEITSYGSYVKTVWINCEINTLIKRDTRQLYAKAMLPDNHPEKIYNLTGWNDPFEKPLQPNLVINTHMEMEETSIGSLANYIISELAV